MRLDRETRSKIIEILAVAALSQEERLLGVPQTDDSIKTLKERAMTRDITFYRQVLNAAHAIFNAIEGPPRSEIERIRDASPRLIHRDRRGLTILMPGTFNQAWVDAEIAAGGYIVEAE